MQAINMTERSAIALRLPKLVQADDSVMSLSIFLTLHLVIQVGSPLFYRRA